jgi:hypothetical protein
LYTGTNVSEECAAFIFYPEDGSGRFPSNVSNYPLNALHNTPEDKSFLFR